MTTPRTRLSDLDLSMVSLVRAGDDPMAKAVLYKSAPDKNHNGGDSASTISDQTSKERAMPDSKIISKADLDPEVVAYIDALEEAVDDRDATIKSMVEKAEADETAHAEALAAAEAAAASGETTEDDVEKAIAKADPATAAVLRKMQADTAEAQAVAKAERDERLTRDFVSKAKELPHITESPAELGAILKGLADVAPEHAEKIEQILKAANAQLDAADIFKEIGKAGSSTTVSASLESAAEAVRKSDPTLTPEQAMVKAMESNPALYDESLRG